MAVPTHDKLMLPLLEFVADRQEYHIRNVSTVIGEYLQLSDQDLNELMPSGTKTKFYDRMQWAKTYLTKANLLEKTGRGLFRITSRGIDVLNSQPIKINSDFLMQFEEFAEFKAPNRSNDNGLEVISIESEQTPKELIYSAYQGIRKELAEELLEYVLTASPAFFEQLVVELLLAMGYGGSLQDAGKTIGGTADGGLDGYIQEDKLGLDVIYIQAKRWALDNSVGSREIRDFVGGLTGEGATKGVFITTSKFTQKAVDFVNTVRNPKVILIDGTQLAQLMIEHDIGVSVEATYVVKKVDRDYFDVE